jgi:hypothetical protein
VLLPIAVVAAALQSSSGERAARLLKCSMLNQTRLAVPKWCTLSCQLQHKLILKHIKLGYR